MSTVAMRDASPRRAGWMLVALAGLVPMVLLPMREWGEFWPIGLRLPDVFGFAFIVASMFALCAVAAGGLLALFRATRRAGILVATGGLALVAGTASGAWLSGRVHERGLMAVQQRAEPVIAAIRDHERRAGVPPASLSVVFPQGESGTGMAAFPRFDYRVADPGKRLGADRWELGVRWGEFMTIHWMYYRPSESYPDAHQRLGSWGRASD